MNEPEQTPGLADILARGFSFPLIFLVALVGIAVGIARYQAERNAIQPRDPNEIPAPDLEPDATPAPGETPARSDVSPREVEDALNEGRFADARRLARDLGNSVLIERAHLFDSLTTTIEPGPFASTKSISRLQGPDGELIGMVRQDADGVRVLQLDGRERSLPKSALSTKEELSGEDKRQALVDQLRAARSKLGDSAGGLALHRLAYLAFSADLRTLGAGYLSDALKGKEGSILVDMFGEGDFDRLHRAQRLLAGVLDSSGQPVAMASPTVEPLRPDPSRDPSPTVQPSSAPTPTTTTTRVDGVDVTHTTQPKSEGPDPLGQERSWKDASSAYRSGLQLYRGTLRLSNRMAAISIKAAMKEFQRAQTLLDPLARKYEGHLDFERRQQELAQLVIDCMRRQRIHD
jgi:hypothetical protein